MPRYLIYTLYFILIISYTTLHFRVANAELVKQPNEFIINFPRPLDGINPFTKTGYVYTDFAFHVFDRLVETDSNTGVLVGLLAEKWTISEDGKTYTFFLRKNAQFHDGTPVTAEDIKFSYEAHGDPKYKSIRYSPIWNEVKVEVVDSSTVKFITPIKSYTYLEDWRYLYILPKHFYGDLSQEAKWSKTLIGSGPYKLKSFDLSKKIELEKNESWWGNRLPKYKGRYNFSKYTMRFFVDPVVIVELLKRGGLDYHRFLESDDFLHFEKIVAGSNKIVPVKSKKFILNGNRLIVLNLRNPLFMDKRVRQALLYLFDRGLVNEKLFQKNLILATGPWHCKHPQANSKVRSISYDPKKALELLKEAGWTDTDNDGVLDKIVNGKKTNFSFTILNYQKEREKLLTMYKEYAKKIGIQVNVQTLEAKLSFRLMSEGKFEAFYSQSVFNATDINLYMSYHSKFAVGDHPWNESGYQNIEFDKLLEKINEALDASERKKLLHHAYEVLADDLPVLPMFDDMYVMYGVSPKAKRSSDSRAYEIGYDYWSF